MFLTQMLPWTFPRQRSKPIPLSCTAPRDRGSVTSDSEGADGNTCSLCDT
jgi:hypothetical protein